MSASYRWMGVGELDLASLGDALEAEGLTAVSRDLSRGKVVLRGGSQLRVRLLGDLFTTPRQLPIRVELHGYPAGGAGRFVVRLDVHAGLDGIGGQAPPDRFEQSAAPIRQVVEDRLATMGEYAPAVGPRS